MINIPSKQELSSMKKLPIGISTLEKIRSGNYLYIDKTHHIAQLANNAGDYYFLSRPRRFGKSLLVNTLKQAFLGNKELFRGLYLENHWDWSKQYPVIHLSFGSGVIQSRSELDAVIHAMLDRLFNVYEIDSAYENSVNNRFNYLFTKLYEKYKAGAVLLIDEYDKPILDNIANSEKAIEVREGLKNLYSVIKDNDQYLKFVLLTGVSKFSKVSLFSGLNNLNDITLNSHYADICGYTQAELEATFADYITHGNVNLKKLKKWYNGYNFAGTEKQKVYNPFDILLFCSNSYQYKSYWFETATPTFLIKLIEKNRYFIPKLEQAKVTDESLSTFDVGQLPIETLLFQTGYLTIKKVITIGTQYAYVLTYPNLEVKASLNSHLMRMGSSVEQMNESFFAIDEALKENDFYRLKLIFNSHFASIPSDWYRKNPIGQYEGFYAGIVYSCFTALGYDARAEDATSAGKIDLTLYLPDKILIIEFKLAKYGSAQDALNQIKNKRYADKFQADKRPVYLVGMSFDDEKKEVEELLWEMLAIS